MVLGCTATKVVVLGSGLGSLLGFFVMSVCVVLIGVVLLVMSACVVLLGVVLLGVVLLVLFCPGAPTLFCLSKIK